MNVSKTYCAKTWITAAVLHTKKHILEIPPKDLQKYKHATFLLAITNLKQLNCK